MKTPILGSTYVGRSVNVAADRMINLYPEVVPEAGKEPAFLSRAPGLTAVVSVSNGPIRGTWVMGGVLYVVSGSTLYKVDSQYAVTSLGTVTAGTTPVSMSDNGIQVIVVCNPSGYTYTPGTSTFAQITDVNFPGAVTVDYVDGYFVINQPSSRKVWTSNLLDGTTWNSLGFASATGSNANTVAVCVTHKETWVFTSRSAEVWYDAGTIPFPLATISGALNDVGCAAAFSIARADNSIFWLGADARGQGIVYRSHGYAAERISTHAIEYAIQQYSTISDAVAYSYQQEGHTFYVLTFPSGNATWVYDVATQEWHQRASLTNGVLGRHFGNCQAFFNNKVLVGDYQNGNIYALDLSNYTDNGAPQKWLRSWRALNTDQNDLKRTAQHSLQLDCETGVGTVSGQGSDPQVMLRWSDDGGHTWSNEHWTSMGALGNYGQRAIWRRLGMTQKLRDRVYEISGTDPVKVTILGAELQMSGTNG